MTMNLVVLWGKIDNLMDDKEAIEKRFMDKVYMEPNSGCWLWTGSGRDERYGCTSVKSLITGKHETVSSHRLSYELFKGKIIKGMCVLHKCDVTCCVNPEHLFLGTNKENSEDMVKKQRNKIGANHPMAKLNEFQVRVIKRLLELKTIIQPDIAEMFGIYKSSVQKIKTGYTWRNLELKRC